ncbi:carbon-nitrogen family hydrolase [Desulfonema ishimotonii]|uniref:Carbon-nitrogen family hydrolase n=1 Tax=Desulfonema ishimotonii TaxID=45657 RepID=A0A401FW80_9BACT|nr:carbon-nitrogen family hydrolase [Desulfonema ishimotonii]GBC61194.1 carbon-nitrogen family hydrolase [Desulfonema ishimotonii]
MKDRQQAFRGGFVQFDVKLGETDANLAAVTAYIEELAQQGVSLAVLPEMWTCGFDNDNLPAHARRTPEILVQLGRLAVRHRMIIAGSMPESDGDRVFNTLYLIDADGSPAGAYRKVHLFSVTGENRYFAAGDRNVVCDTSLGRIGLMTCYDLRFPELCRALTLRGAGLILVPAQWPDTRIDRWDVLARARAIENQVYLIGCNRCGTENNTVFSGHSLIADPSGEVLQWLENGESGIRYADIRPDRIRKIREYMPSLKERMPEAYAV